MGCAKKQFIKILEVEELEKQIKLKDFISFMKVNKTDLLKELYKEFLEVMRGN